MTEQQGASSWRYKAGLSLFVLGHLVLLGGVVIPALGLAGESAIALAGGMVVSGEVIAMTSIVFLGKAGFIELKNKIGGAAKSTFTAPIGPVRHSVGIFLFLLNFIVLYFVVYATWASLSQAAPDAPPPQVWGLNLEQQWDLIFGAFLAGEVAFVISLWVLGADWWERFRNLFIWHDPNQAS